MADQRHQSSDESVGKSLTQENAIDVGVGEDRSINDATPAALEVEREARIRVKNRRKMYLESHPLYFESPDLELAGI